MIEAIQKTLSSFAPVAHNVITELSFLFLFCQNLAVLAITLTFLFHTASAYFQIYELLSFQILSILEFHNISLFRCKSTVS